MAENDGGGGQSWLFVLLTMINSMLQSQQQTAREQARNTAFIEIVKRALDALNQARSSEEWKSAMKQAQSAVNRYFDAHAFSPDASAHAEPLLKASLEGMHDLSAMLEDETLRQGKWPHVHMRRKRVVARRLEQRVSRGDLITLINSAQNELMTISQQAVMTLVQAMEAQHLIRQLTGTTKMIAIPILSDGPAAIEFPKPTYTNPHDHVRYVQDRIVALADAIEDNTSLFERRAQNGHGGGHPRAVISTANSLLEYTAMISMTLDRLRDIAGDDRPYHPGDDTPAINPDRRG